MAHAVMFSGLVSRVGVMIRRAEPRLAIGEDKILRFLSAFGELFCTASPVLTSLNTRPFCGGGTLRVPRFCRMKEFRHGCSSAKDVPAHFLLPP